MAAAYPEPATRAIITASIIVATVLDTLDSTIANVALPHIKSSVSASQEEIVWILTSYIIATAIATPLSGWLAERFGRKTVMLVSVAGFTAASAACGMATSLYGLVLFRIIQGACGAGLIPLSQAILLDINPPERHGNAMAIYGMSTMIGPVMGPVLGGWLTDAFSWRWVFFINLPFGVASLIGMSGFLSDTRSPKPGRFDLMGFCTLSLFLASLQLMLDRGQQLDWFSSPEIRAEAAVMAFFAYVTVVHTFTTKDSFIKIEVFRDRNFFFGSMLCALLGVLVFAVIPLVATMIQQLLNYPVLYAGLIVAPRGIGTAVSLFIGSQLITRVDNRLLLFTGLGLSAAGMYVMAHMTLDMDAHVIVETGVVQGFSSAMAFLPLTILVFSTLNPRLRNEGATLFALIRNLGASIGISALQTMTIRNTATVQSRLVEQIRPDSLIVAMRAPDFDFNAPAAVAGMEHAIFQQASMVAYLDTYWFLFLLTVVMMPIALLLRLPKGNAQSGASLASH